MSLHIHIQAGIVRALRQVPAVDLPGAPLHQNLPVSWPISLGDPTLGSSIQSKDAAHSVILSAEKPEDIRQRRLAPMQSEFRGLQPCGSPCQVAEDSNRSRRLQ